MQVPRGELVSEALEDPVAMEASPEHLEVKRHRADREGPGERDIVQPESVPREEVLDGRQRLLLVPVVDRGER